MSSPKNPLKPNPNLTNWTIVTARKLRKNQTKRIPLQNPSSTETLAPTPWAPSDLDDKPDPNLRSKIRKSLDRLSASRFSHHFLSQLRSPEIRSRLSDLGERFHLVIYGIGSVDSFPSPRLQLSLTVLLLRELGPAVLSIEAFDPVLSAPECAAIEELGITVLRVNESGRREVRDPTLFFMPHCEIKLYNNLLEANWGKGKLSKIAILGNSFDGYKDSTRLTLVGKKVMLAARFVTEVRIDVDEWEEHGFFNAFHDMSWHFFRDDDGGDDDDDVVNS